MNPLWRVVRAEFAGDPLSTMGAYLFPGRWHSAGQHVLYAASTESLARNERLVHLAGEHDIDFVLLELALPEGAKVDAYEDLPIQAPTWRAIESTQARGVGDWWIEHSTALGLSVPSMLSATERNVILARRSPLFAQVRVASATPFRYDQRFYPSKE
ncbi:MAG TPA: RES family NAD+ phosphorylase [Rhodanobacteraceae bacterium]|nr:RES family NAD+ phosphorylase [Rhodanobacteraceae bacterium]